MQARRVNQELKAQSLGVSVVLFLAGAGLLAVAYAMLLTRGLLRVDALFWVMIGLGSLGTLLFFRSLSGFLLRVCQSSKRLYYRNLNMFVLRQFNARINTTYRSMTVICLMLLLAIGITASSVGLNNTVEQMTAEQAPQDVELIFYPEQEGEVDLPALLAEGGAAHISGYLLKIEPGTPFGKNPPQSLPNEDEAADFYLYAVDELAKAGYAQYEISNFAKPGFEGRHNLIYWDCGDYLGLGPAAHSCMGGRRFYYPPDTAAFLNDAAAPVMDGSCGAEDYLILQLRLRKGLSLDAYKKLYGKEFSTAQLAFVQNCVRAGYASFDGRTLALTPAGLIVQNSILAQLL